MATAAKTASTRTATGTAGEGTGTTGTAGEGTGTTGTAGEGAGTTGTAGEGTGTTDTAGEGTGEGDQLQEAAAEVQAAVLMDFDARKVGDVVRGRASLIQSLASSGFVDPHPDAVEHRMGAGAKVFDLGE